MNFEELSDSLPNGFHDAEMLCFEMDYLRRTIRFDFAVWIGLMSDPERREIYRPARVTLHNVGFLVIEAPDENYSWDEPGKVVIDTGSGVPDGFEGTLPKLQADIAVTWMYVEEFHSCILFSGGTAELQWTVPEEKRT